MISNIPVRRLNEKFIVEIGAGHGDSTWITVYNNGNNPDIERAFRITEFNEKSGHQMRLLLEAVLDAGIKQGKEEVRIALGMKE
jgi:hypothetical protein